MTDTTSLPPLAADAAQVAALSPESRASIGDMLKLRGYAAADVARIYGQPATPAEPTPAAGGDVLPSYAAHKPGPSGISPSQATAFYEKFAGMAPVKNDGESDADFAARQTVHQTQLDTLRGAIGREFDMDLVEDARTDAEQAFDAVFPAADPSEIRIDQPLVRALANGADVVANWQQALAPVGLPAAIASQVGSAILETSNRLADADASTMAAHWSRERELVERIAARQGMNWDAIKVNVRAALDRVPVQHREQIVKSRGLNSATVVLQLALAGQRIAERTARGAR